MSMILKWQSKPAFSERHMNPNIYHLFTGGYDLWLSTCMAYGESMEEKGNYNVAATYYIATGDADRAINMFRSKNMIK
jgi:hypothetical protein